MTHPIKYARAKRIAHVGQHHQTFRAIWDTIPQEAQDALTSRAIAALADSMRIAYNRGASARSRELAAEGVIGA